MQKEDRPLLGAVLVTLVVVAIEIPLTTYATDSNWLSAWSNFGILIATIFVVGFTGQQLVGISRTQKEAKNDQRKWATLQVCDRYDSDPLIQEAVAKLNWDSATLTRNQRDLYATRLLNYFSSIAIGLGQDFYDDAIARAHIGYLAVDWFNYIVTKQGYEPEATRKSFSSLSQLVDRWAPLVAARPPVGTTPSSLPRE